MKVHVGSIDEEYDEKGIAHMIEHVAFLGSKKREKLLGTGARSNAYIDFHHTMFHIHSPTSTNDHGIGPQNLKYRRSLLESTAPKRRNQPAPQPEDPLGEHVSHAEFRAAFTTLAQSMVA
ncbi:hypothetical protein BC332_15840 [Capsicum chinense]|nr:hypothetical protein BC332_15840 [Capsicum chinense]